MNIKITLKDSNGIPLQIAFFKDEESKNNWLNMLQETKAWGDFEDLIVLIEDYSAQVEQNNINLEARKYLLETDYVITKISEAIILDKDVSALKIKYAEILSKRDTVRGKII